MNLSSPLPIQHHSFPVWIFLSHPRTSIEGKKAGFSMVCLDGYVRLPDGIYQYYMCSISCVYNIHMYINVWYVVSSIYIYMFSCFHVYTHLRLEKLKKFGAKSHVSLFFLVNEVEALPHLGMGDVIRATWAFVSERVVKQMFQIFESKKSRKITQNTELLFFFWWGFNVFVCFCGGF